MIDHEVYASRLLSHQPSLLHRAVALEEGYSSWWVSCLDALVKQVHRLYVCAASAWTIVERGKGEGGGGRGEVVAGAKGEAWAR